MRFTFIPFILSASVFTLGQAQSFSGLPPLLPSYSEDFSYIKSYPSLCFNNAFFDQQGRLWLTPCPGRQIGLHLVQFDGYDFSVVRGNLDQLPSDSRFVAIDGNGQFVGYVNEAGNQQAFFYNQAANQLAF
ncbi:MAG: hypothetical protein J5I94_27200, partial [Phaeodactylibacter sp.]|nr:hypothetical protein [Phaeodactylibacter sp.]